MIQKNIDQKLIDLCSEIVDLYRSADTYSKKKLISKSKDFFEASSFSGKLFAPKDRTEVSLSDSIFEYAERICSIVISSGKMKSVSIGYYIPTISIW